MNSNVLPRRSRAGSPRPIRKRLVLSAPDFLVFEAIDRHGPLPSSYLYELTKHLRRDRTHLQNRLTEFHNGDDSGAFLTRPPQQFASYRARYQHVVYDLAPRARRAMAERGSLTSYGRARCDPFVHRLMAACVSASFELTASTLGLRHIAFQEILDHERCGAARTATNPLALPTSNASSPELIPDVVFGLEYPDAGYRFFAVEIDRNTESIERRNLRQSAFARKVEGYVAALLRQSYRSWWGLPNLHVLTVTTNATHARKLVEHIRQHVPPKMQSRFAVMADTTFGADWRVPSELLNHVITGEWAIAGGFRSLASASSGS